MWTLIRQCAVRVLVLIRITVLDLEPNPDFQTFLIISETYYRIFKCSTSKRRSGQELLFIFFELRAPTCLWGRYDPKTENFTYFYIYLLHINFLSKTFYVPVKSYPRATFHVLVAKVYVVTGAHYITKSKIPLFAKALSEIPITFLIINQIKRVIPCYKKHDTSFSWYYCGYDISTAILDLDPDLCQNFLFFVPSSILHIETCMIPLSKAVHKGFISFSYT